MASSFLDYGYLTDFGHMSLTAFHIHSALYRLQTGTFVSLTGSSNWALEMNWAMNIRVSLHLADHRAAESAVVNIYHPGRDNWPHHRKCTGPRRLIGVIRHHSSRDVYLVLAQTTVPTRSRREQSLPHSSGVSGWSREDTGQQEHIENFGTHTRRLGAPTVEILG